MNLLEEIRNVDPGSPGLWSTRVSLLLACALFLLVSLLGIQFRVRGQLLPQLAHATERLPELQQRLATAHRKARRIRNLQSETEQLLQDIRETGLRIPQSGKDLDLTVSLTAGLVDSAIETVQPWQMARELARPLPYAGTELLVSGSYAQVLEFLHLALASEHLRELIDLRMEPVTGEGPGPLRTRIRLLAYFASESFPGVLPGPGEKNEAPGSTAFSPALADLPSPFATAPPEIAQGPAAKLEPLHGARPRGSGIQVGTRSYEIVEDQDGNLRLEQGGS